ncbi:hypothetical protein [Streptomyces sp. NBC_00859]|nr:hypothetical protein OG584_01665 [Streptomyces sp. NBC_00859]
MLADRVRRDHASCTAIYRDLGLAREDAPDRDHIAPVLGSI